jgi:BirA family biotin operon repressor/biotin-[acetyl-CoA-carboxylase] ligase
LNLNQELFISNAPNPVSLKQITGNDYDVKEIAMQIWEYTNIWYEKLKTESFKAIDSAYFNQLFRVNEWAVFAINGNKFEAKITGTGEFGQLILEDRNGRSTEYMFKEVEFVI